MSLTYNAVVKLIHRANEPEHHTEPGAPLEQYRTVNAMSERQKLHSPENMYESEVLFNLLP